MNVVIVYIVSSKLFDDDMLYIQSQSKIVWTHVFILIFIFLECTLILQTSRTLVGLYHSEVSSPPLALMAALLSGVVLSAAS